MLFTLTQYSRAFLLFSSKQKNGADSLTFASVSFCSIISVLLLLSSLQHSSPNPQSGTQGFSHDSHWGHAVKHFESLEACHILLHTSYKAFSKTTLTDFPFVMQVFVAAVYLCLINLLSHFQISSKCISVYPWLCSIISLSLDQYVLLTLELYYLSCKSC